MLRYTMILLAGLGMAVPASAGSWADAMFEELSKDFGSVPRGPALSHPFQVTNNTGQPVHISSVRVSCGCVSASAADNDVEPGKSTVINAHMDTRRFTGHKSVTVYVTFDRPHYQEVRLLVQANGRDDFSVSPEAFSLGQAKRGTRPETSVTVSFYDGQSQITGIEKESNYILTSLKEVRSGSGQLTYQVSAAVRPDCPVGKWYSDVWLKTNNASMPRVRVPLTVEIQTPLTISPGTVALGTVMTGAEAERKVIVRGTKPFKITRVQGADAQLSVRDTTAESKEVHILTIKFKPTKEGDFSRKLKVVTDLKEEGEVEFEATAKVEQSAARE